LILVITHLPSVTGKRASYGVDPPAQPREFWHNRPVAVTFSHHRDLK
jgi:hypothetical protein